MAGSGKKSKFTGQVVYRPKKVEFKVDGKKYDVSYVTLGLSLNSVPTCEIGIAPASADGKIKINSLELVSLKDVFTDLSKKAKESVKSSLYAELESSAKDAGFPNQVIDLKDWLLVSCGLEEINTVSPFALTCVIAHPAYQLNYYSGCFFAGSGTIDLGTRVDEVADPIDASVKAMEAVEDANEMDVETICRPMTTTSVELKDPETIKQELMNGLGKLKELVPELVVWDASYTGGDQDIPCDDVPDPVPYGIKYALLDMWVLPVGEQSYWGMLSSVRGEFFFDVIPTYWEDHLTVAPLNPYGGPKVTMPSTMVNVVDMPGFDPDPLYGVIMYQGQGTTESSDTVTFAEGAKGSAIIQSVNIAFVPAKSEFAGGKLIHAKDPSWLQFAMSKAAQSEDTEPEDDGEGGNSGSYAEPDEDDEDGNNDPGIKETLELWNQVRLRYLNTLFVADYRSNVTAGMSCAFCTKTRNGEYVAPGSILSFMSDGELFRGKITTVTHNIDCAQSRATTQIQLAYCDVDGGTSNVLGDPVVIPFYNTVYVEDTSGNEEED